MLCYEELRERLRAIPGGAIRGRHLADAAHGAGSQAPYADDEETEQNWESVTADARSVTEDYFAAAGMRITAGRSLEASDIEDRPLVVVVETSRPGPPSAVLDQKVKDDVFGTEDAVGRGDHGPRAGLRDRGSTSSARTPSTRGPCRPNPGSLGAAERQAEA